MKKPPEGGAMTGFNWAAAIKGGDACSERQATTKDFRMVRATKAFQVSVRNDDPSMQQVFFVGAADREAALKLISDRDDLLPNPKLDIQRELSDIEIEGFKIEDGVATQYL